MDCSVSQWVIRGAALDVAPAGLDPEAGAARVLGDLENGRRVPGDQSAGKRRR